MEYLIGAGLAVVVCAFGTLVGFHRDRVFCLTLVTLASQWEGRTSDGRHVYVRYRWGWLTIGIGNTSMKL